MTSIFNKTSEKAKRRDLRHNMPSPEIILWPHLQNKGMNGYKFRRQYSIVHYVVDFYCPALKLAIELDGDSHFVSDDEVVYDRERQKSIEGLGIRFLRFTNDEVLDNLDNVLRKIFVACGGKEE